MKVSLFNIYELLLYGIVLLNLEVLSIISNLDNFAQTIAVILTITIFFIYIFQKNKIIPHEFIVYLYIFLMFIYFFAEIFRLHYFSISGLKILSALSLEKNFIYLLLVMPIFEILNRKGAIFLRNVCYLGLIVLIFRFVVWIFFNKFGINIMPGLFEVRGYNWTHGNGYVRLTGTFLDGLIFSYFCIRMFKTERFNSRIYYALIILFLSYYSFAIYSSRSQLICYLFTILYIYIWNSKNKMHTIFNCFIGLVFLVILSHLPAIKEFISSFSSTDATYGAGTMARIYGNKFYSNEWQNSSILFGFGIAEDGNYFGNTQYFLSDLGIVSYIFEFGILGFVLSLIPMLEGLRVGLKSIKNNDGLLLSSLSIYTLLSSFMSQNVYDYIRILIVPFILGITLLVKYNQKNKEVLL